MDAGAGETVTSCAAAVGAVSEGVEFGAGGLVEACTSLSLSLAIYTYLYFVPVHHAVYVLTHTSMQIEKLHEEKAAHEDFVQLRAKQQQDERVHFRKALKRREQEQGDSGTTSDEDEGGLRRNQSLSRLRRLRRFS